MEIKNYTSCFLGIPLPQEYQNEFEQLLRDIHSIDPLIETVQPQTPHITLYYLDQQSQFSLDKISKLVGQNTNILQNVQLTVGGFDFFTKENPRVLFLDIVYSQQLTDFNHKMSELLKEFSAQDNGLEFHPHMTIGRIKNIDAQKSFRENEQKLREKLNEIHWMFKITEVALYGVNATKHPEHQEKLISIPVIL